MRGIQISRFGGPEVLELVDLPEPDVGDGQVRIEVRAAGVNYADTHQADDSYLQPSHLPLVPGAEVVGLDREGRRVVALCAGGYAEVTVASKELVFAVPDGVDDGAALALVLQGTTAWHLLRTSAHLAAGESIVVHAAAGGVGSLAVQLATRWGAGRVIAVASSPDKRALATRLGADAVVDSGAEDLTAALVEANDGHPVDVVLEMVGGTVRDQSLAALAPFGRLVVFGMASREESRPISPARLLQGSTGVIGFWLAHCMRRPAMLRQALDGLFALTSAGELEPIVGGTYALSDAAQAHRDLRARTTTGKLVLDVSR